MLKLILRIAYTLNTLIEAIIVIRILLSFFVTQSTHVFVQWVRTFSDIFISPFRGIVSSTLVIDSTEIVLTPVIALIFYAILGFVISELIKAFSND